MSIAVPIQELEGQRPSAALRSLLAAFLIGAGLVQPAAAQDTTCNGRSLLEDFQRETPALYEEALTEFEAIPNSSGLLWRVQRPNLEPSWLFGTMHVADPAITELRPTVAAAFAGADTLVIESIEVVDPEFTAEFAQEILAVARLPEGETFDTGFSEEQKTELAEMTAAHGLPYFMARRMKPWFLSVMLSLPPCASLPTLQGEPVLDQKLFLDATAAGKEVVGLESLAEQLEALTSLEAVMDETALLEILAVGMQGIEDWYATLVHLYTEEMVTFLVPLLDRSSEFTAMATAMEDVETTLVTARNLRMHERLLPVIASGDVFVGVGALHLSGEDGLVELLRKSGYVVTRIE